MVNKKHQLLPEYFRPIFWSYKFNKINPETDVDLVINQVINYGTLKHLSWIRQYYGKERIQKSLATIPATNIRPQAKKLISILFNAHKFNDSPRSAHKRSVTSVS